MAEPRTCPCGNALGRRNTSGRCQRCAVRETNARAETRAIRSRAMKLRWQEPEYREQVSQALKVHSAKPEVRAKRSQNARAMKLNQLGVAAMRDPALNAKRARRCSQTKMPWCPPHLIEEARRLRRAHFKAEEIKQIIAAEVEAEKERVRNRMGGAHG